MNIYNRTGLVYRLCGEEYLGYVRHLIDKYQLHDNVILLPRLSAEDMANEMLSANVFLSPSSIDNSPNSVGEAMMLGLPIVSTPVGGVTSFVHHEENGLLAEPEELSNAIGRLFDDNKLATRLASNAYHTALQRHDKEKTAEQYISAYKDILKQQ
jgi:glycosyltransferase involved in cell wall biosynthesis